MKFCPHHSRWENAFVACKPEPLVPVRQPAPKKERKKRESKFDGAPLRSKRNPDSAKVQMDRLMNESDLTLHEKRLLVEKKVTLTKCKHCDRVVYRDRRNWWRHLEDAKVECGNGRDFVGRVAMAEDNRKRTVKVASNILP